MFMLFDYQLQFCHWKHVYSSCVLTGQEEPTIDFDDDIQITPFNMRDEMEEGHFDKDGTFIFDKSKVC